MIANINLELGTYAPSSELVATTTGHRGLLVIRVDAVSHRSCLFTPGERDPGLVQDLGAPQCTQHRPPCSSGIVLIPSPPLGDQRI